MDEHDVIPQQEITLFTPLAEVQTVHPKIRVKNERATIKQYNNTSCQALNKINYNI